MTGITNRRIDWRGQSLVRSPLYQISRKSFPNPVKQLHNQRWLLPCDCWRSMSRGKRLKAPWLTALLLNCRCNLSNRTEYCTEINKVSGKLSDEVRPVYSAGFAWKMTLSRRTSSCRLTYVQVIS